MKRSSVTWLFFAGVALALGGTWLAGGFLMMAALSEGMP